MIIASQRSTSCEILLILNFLLKQGLSTRRPRRRPLLLLWDLIALQLLLPAPKSKQKKSLYTEKCHSKHIVMCPSEQNPQRPSILSAIGAHMCDCIKYEILVTFVPGKSVKQKKMYCIYYYTSNHIFELHWVAGL